MPHERLAFINFLFRAPSIDLALQATELQSGRMSQTRKWMADGGHQWRVDPPMSILDVARWPDRKLFITIAGNAPCQADHAQWRIRPKIVRNPQHGAFASGVAWADLVARW